MSFPTAPNLIDNFISLIINFFRSLLTLLYRIRIQIPGGYLPYLSIIFACIIITAFVSFFYKGGKG